jgi:hypothetical protein
MDLTPRPTADAAGPPGSPRAVRWLLPAAFSCAAVAAALGLLNSAAAAAPTSLGVLDGFRTALAAAGLILGGVAIYRNPGRAGTVALASALAFVTVFAVPASWDSLRLLSGVLGVAAAVGAGILLLPPVGRRLALSLLALVHFGGILVAVTSPPAQPWLTGQTWSHFYRPYLQFMYLNNAYHFYSPEPGPASLLWACLEWSEPLRDASGNKVIDPATGKEKATTHYTWFEFPRRPEDVNDPMQVTYYRRLSITEQINQFNPPPQAVPQDVNALRSMMANPLRSDSIPFHPEVPAPQQYRPLAEASRRTQVPSYARAIADIGRRNQQLLKAKRDAARAAGRPENAKRQANEPADDWELVGLKLYRVQHQILPPEMLALGGQDGKGLSLYDPITYQPFFLGDFDTDGNLRDPQDPLLYWLVPVLRDPTTPAELDKGKRHWKFDLSKGAGGLRDYTMRHATGRFFEEDKP